MRIGIIGGGPAGYSAAIRLSERGNKVQVFEKGEVGGVCLNVGCIPTKSLIYSASLYDIVKSYKREVSWEEIQKKKDLAVKRVLTGLKGLLKENKIEIINKEAVLKGNGSIKSDEKEYQFDKVIVASGSKSVKSPFPAPDDVWDSKDAIASEKLPESIVIIGAGFIGLEFGYIFSCLGSKVWVIEKEDEALPGEDRESAAILRKSLMRKGIKFYFSSEVIEIEKENNKYLVIFKKDDKEQEIATEKVLIAIGRIPNVDNLPVEILEMNKVVKVNDYLETRIKNVYAIGDCRGEYLLAHSAYKDAEIVTKNILGEKRKKDEFIIPRVVYTEPEYASVGYSEEKAKAENIDYKVSRVNIASNGRALATGKTSGYIKLIYEKKGRIVGGIIVGGNASELIPLLSLSMDRNIDVEELSESVFPHPTFSESIREVSYNAAREGL